MCNCRTVLEPNQVASSTTRDVADPLDALVIALLEHLEEAHEQPGRSEHEYLKVNLDRRPAPCFSVCRRTEFRIGLERGFGHALNAWDPTVTCESALTISSFTLKGVGVKLTSKQRDSQPGRTWPFRY